MAYHFRILEGPLTESKGLYGVKQVLRCGEIMTKKRRNDDDVFGNVWDDLSYEDLNIHHFVLSEPMLEVRDYGDVIKVLVEASGSEDGDVAIERIRTRSVDLVLKYKGRHIRKRIELPARVKPSGYAIKVKNGVAQILLRKE